MAISVVMPALEMAQESGKLVAWRKKEGERVAKGEPLLEVETDKAVLEVEAMADGILAGISAEVGAEVAVGKTIAWILQPGESIPHETVLAASGRVSKSAAVVEVPSAEAMRSPSPEVQISPKARRLAQERGIDVSTIRGSGPDGAITTDDVLAAAQLPATPSLAAPSTAARLMAERTTQSWTTVPHFFLTREVDATALQAARAQETGSDGVTITDLLVAAVGRTLRKHPRVNSSYMDGTVRANEGAHVAIAIAIQDAVVTAVIRNADALSRAELAAQRKALVERARNGRLTPADITGGGITVSNLGMYAVDAFQAIIVPPQAAILAVGRIAERVVVREAKPAVRPMFTITLSGDHRVLDGATAARFLQDLGQDIEGETGIR